MPLFPRVEEFQEAGQVPTLQNFLNLVVGGGGCRQSHQLLRFAQEDIWSAVRSIAENLAPVCV